MLHVDIYIISTINPDMELVRTSHHTSIGVIHLGLIGQFHYQALVKLEEHSTANTSSESQVPVSPETKYDQEFVEDQVALKHQAQLRGLPYDSCLLREDTVDATSDIFA